MSKLFKNMNIKSCVIFAKKKKDMETVIYFANCNLRSTYFDQICINMFFIGKTCQKIKKLRKGYKICQKQKMPKVEMPTNSKSQLKWFSSIEWPFLNKSKN